jgi:hypothetical protein
MADDSDLKKKKGGFNLFGKKPKKQEEVKAPEPEKKNWWSL